MNSAEQCWAMNGDGSRCTEPAPSESRFCKYHGRNGGPSPLWIWRAPRPSGSPGSLPAPPAEGLAWFTALLQQAMTETMAGEGTPLQKASAVARLGNLYLKAHRSAELERANAELRRQTERLEERLAAAESRLAALAPQPATPAPAAPETDTLPVAVDTSGDTVCVPTEQEGSLVVCVSRGDPPMFMADRDIGLTGSAATPGEA